MKKTAVLVLTGALAQGCAPDGPLGTVGAIVTAPITAPVMFFSARMNDREDFLERARRNDRPLPPIDARSRAMARSTLEQALERGTIDQGVYWRNDEDPSGYASGSVTVLATRRMEEGSGMPRGAYRDRDRPAPARPSGTDVLSGWHGLERCHEHPGMSGNVGTRTEGKEAE